MGERMQYQIINSINPQRYERRIWKNFSHVLHLHRFLEIAYVLEGEILTTINGREHRMGPGDLAIVFPHALHEYRALTPNKVAVYIVANELIPYMAGKLEVSEADSYMFHPDKVMKDYFEQACLGEDEPSPLLIRSVFYGLLHAYLQTCELTRKSAADSELILQILSYLAEHFQEEITLKDIAGQMGYNYNYVSKIFHQEFHVNFKRLLNLNRLDRAYRLLRETSQDITTIAMECGFQSIRNFNRIFLQSTGEQPLKYRRRFQK